MSDNASKRAGRSKPFRQQKVFLSLTVGSSLLLAACTSTHFAVPVKEFGVLTQKASVDQIKSLTAIAADEDERFRADLANRLVDLRVSRDCAIVLSQITTGLAPEETAKCGFVADGQPIVQPAPFVHLIALSEGLKGYADGVIALTEDPTADNQAFSQSTTALAASLGKLDGAVQTAIGATPVDRAAKLGALATLVAEGGQLIFAQRRGAALRRIILAADPIVQEATTLLTAADQRIDLYSRAGVAQQLMTAQKEQSLAALHKDPRALRVAQDRMFALLATFNQPGASAGRFAAIGQAHAALARAAELDASIGELKAAIVSLAHLASTIQTTADAFKVAAKKKQ